MRSKLLMMAARGLSTASRRPLRGVVFDLDGTLTVPNLDFKVMYERCGVPQNEDILEAIAAMPDAEAAKAAAIVEEMEEEGRRTLELTPGAREFAEWLARQGIPTALVTRNTRSTIDHLHATLWKGLPPFSPAISRDDTYEPKPHPAALEAILKTWEIADPSEVVMIGDSPANDVVFGKKAGVATALVDSGRRFVEGGSDEGASMVVENIAALAARFHERFELPKAGPLQKYDVPAPGSDAAKAAAAGDLARLEACDDVTTPDASGNTPLIWAADSGAADCVPYLRDRCDVNHRGYLGATAVCRAARKGNLDALQLLLKADGVDVNAPNDKMQSPLREPASPRHRCDRSSLVDRHRHFAAFKKNRACVEALLAAGASTYVLDRKGRTPAEDTSDEEIRAAILAAR